MISPIAKTQEGELFNYLVRNTQSIREGVQNLKNIGITQKDILLRTIAKQSQAGIKNL